MQELVIFEQEKKALLKKFKLKPYEPADRVIIEEWFSKRDFPSPEDKFLPPTGVLALDNNIPIACGFMFKTDANVASIGHLISDPEIEKEKRQDAIKQLILVLARLAESEGFGLVTIATNIKKLGERFETLNFIKTDENVSHYRRDLCPLLQP